VPSGFCAAAPHSGIALPPCHFATLPLSDWQFWVVSALFVAALAYLFRGTLPIIGKRVKTRRRTRRVALTVEGKSPEQANSEQ